MEASQPKVESSAAPEANSTAFVHAGVAPDPLTGAICKPIYFSTTFVQPSVEEYLQKGFSYSRSANPTVSALEERMRAIEGGAQAVCFSSGMAATVAVLTTFLSAGDHCVMPQCVYGGSFRAANEYLRRFGVEFDFVDFREVAAVEAALRQNTKLVFAETPANPTLQLTDLAAIDLLLAREEVRRAGLQGAAAAALLLAAAGPQRQQQRQVLLVVDSTFATPLLLQPLALGADVVLHSTTKFIDGHNVTTGGCAVARQQQLAQQIAHTRNVCGSIMDPQTAAYQLSFAATLPLRLLQQSSTALLLASFLEKKSQVRKVLYPGLDSHPQRALARKYHRGGLHGAVLGFELNGGVQAGMKLMNTIGYPFSLCENLGSVQSLITCPAVFTHAQLTKEQQQAIGLSEGYVRLSVGLESPQDLISALDKALQGLDEP
ncbi:cystathionine beta-lyase, putative [Eimeria necatrix]|uniref:Cystathionine beta-lyase, putative n=1 Tax=Eimeria necatrix TaxID=51315 RepID=U6N1I5_9EIME|nr:cystathionine beta-lyase, putative [Eimeria necatrix]CDJ70052.1 cystathionine beta-lyase, putative [Eimeria necatrix]